jgi:hypothetical protein
MPGSRYRLGKATRSIHAEDGSKGFVLIPEGVVLLIDSFDRSGRLVKVKWGSQLLLMFWQDLLERGVEVEDVTPTNARSANQSL